MRQWAATISSMTPNSTASAGRKRSKCSVRTSSKPGRVSASRLGANRRWRLSASTGSYAPGGAGVARERFPRTHALGYDLAAGGRGMPRPYNGAAQGMRHRPQNVGDPIYAPHIRLRQFGQRAPYFNAYGRAAGMPDLQRRGPNQRGAVLASRFGSLFTVGGRTPPRGTAPRLASVNGHSETPCGELPRAPW